MKRKHNFKKENCDSKVRATIQINNVVISLCGTHGYCWNVVVEDKNNNKITINEFFDRELAKEQFNKTKELYIPKSIRKKIK